MDSNEKPLARRTNDNYIIDKLSEFSSKLSSIESMSKMNQDMNVKNEIQNKETHSMLSNHIREETEHAHKQAEETRKMHQEQKAEHQILLAFFDDMTPKVHLKAHEFIVKEMDNDEYFAKTRKQLLEKWTERAVVAIITLIAGWTFMGFKEDAKTHFKQFNDEIKQEQSEKQNIKPVNGGK